MTSKGHFLLILAILLKGSLAELEYIEADKCPEYNSLDYKLTARRHQCNDTFPLHCAQLQNSEKFALHCLKAKNCTQGQQPFIPSDASDTVLCKFCHGNTYNSDYSKPSNSYTTCRPMTTLREGLIPCEHLKLKTSDPEYHNHNHYMRCNTSENYVLDNNSVYNSTRDMNGYCTNETTPRCIKQQCKEEEELIKDYSCVDKCRSDEYRADNLTCVKHQTGPSTTPGPLTTPGHVTNVVRKESSPQPASPTVTQTTEPTKNVSTDDTKKKGVDVGETLDVNKNFTFGIVIGIVIGICPIIVGLLVVLLVGLLVSKKRGATIQYIDKLVNNNYLNEDPGKASQNEGDSDGDRPHNMYPQQETGADNQGSQQPNTDNGVNLETLDPFPRTFGDLKDKLQRAISWEEKVDVILNHFGQLQNERNSWDMFGNSCNWIHENVFLKNLLPSLPLPSVPCRPNSPDKKYRNTPAGFTAFESSGRQNSCLYQSVSLLLVGDESLFKLLRVKAAVFAARHFEMAAEQIREHLKYEQLDVDLYYKRHLTDKAFERHKDEMNTEETNKKYLQELIMETPILNAMSSQIHAMFLCGAIRRPIHQHLLPQHEHYRHMFHEQLDPKACFSDEGYDEKLSKLHIMWVNNEDNPNKEINHVVPLWKEEEEMYHPVNQSPEAIAFKGSMTTQEDKKCDKKKNDDGAAE